MKTPPPVSTFRPWAARRLGVLSLAAAGLLAAFTPSSQAMQIICDMNTLPVSEYTTVGPLKCGGCWCVFNDSPTSSQVSSVITNLGTGIVVAENIYPGLANYTTAKNSGHTPTAAFSYHEGSGADGCTVLTSSEIANIKGQIGSSSVIVLTRRYNTSGWIDAVNGALANASCSGVAMEIAPYYTNEANPDIISLANYCVSKGKNLYLLFADTSSTGPTYYEQLRDEFRYLLQNGAPLSDSHIILTFGGYAATSAPWLGSEGDNSIQAGLIWANNQNTWPVRYYFQDQYSLLYMDVAGASTANNAVVDQFTLKSASNQQWFLLYATGGHYNMMNVNSNSAASVQGDGTGNGNGVVQFSLTGTLGSTGQLWTPQASGSAWLFYNDTNGKVLDDNNTKTAGAQLIQTTHSGATTQLWNRTNAP